MDIKLATSSYLHGWVSCAVGHEKLFYLLIYSVYWKMDIFFRSL